MKLKLTPLKEVWKESKPYVAGVAAALGLVVGSAFTYDTVIRPVTSTVSVNVVRAEDEPKELSYSMYDMSAWLSAYYNAASSPSGWQSLAHKTSNASYDGKALLTQAAVKGSESSGQNWSLATNTWVKDDLVGGGGALLGFPDEKVVSGSVFGFLSSLTSASTTDYSFDSLKTSSKGYNSLQAYALYGASLQSLGIDASLGSGPFGQHPIRMMAGGLVWLAYIIASFVEKVFGLATAILQITNPFKWFVTAMEYTWTTDDAGIFSGLANLVSHTYKIFSYFGWTVLVPIIVSSFIFLVIFSGNGRQSHKLDERRRGKFRYGVIYILFIAVGVPFMGTAYTAGLDAMAASFGTEYGKNSFSADAVILSTYVDNEKWIEGSRMYLPNDVHIVWDKEAKDVTPNTKAAIRQTALAINALNYNEAKNIGNIGGSANWNINDTSQQGSNVLNVSSLLWRYMRGNTYSAGTWENNVKAHLIQEAEQGDGRFTLSIAAAATELTSREGYKYIGYVDPNVTGTNAGGIVVDDGWWRLFGIGDNPINVGGAPNMFLTKGYADQGRGGITIEDQGKYLRLMANNQITNDGKAGFGRENATMSYLEMYNYLNSTFRSNKVQVYSTNALASNFGREQHAAVNQVGSGTIHKFLIWFNTGVMLFGLAILALGYAFGMLVGAFRRYFDIIQFIFTGTLGFQKGMVKSAAGTIMLIVETLGTLVLYELIKTFYIGIPGIVEGAFAALTSTPGVENTKPSFAAVVDPMLFITIVFGLLLSSALLIWSTIMMLRLRKPIMEMLDNTFTKLIRKLFYVDGQAPSDAPDNVLPSKGGGMVGGLSAMGGLTAAAMESNIDGADDDGWSDSDKHGNDGGEDASSGDTGEQDGPDAKVASSRETEAKGAKFAETGKLNRDGDVGDASGTSDAGDATDEAHDGAGDVADTVDATNPSSKTGNDGKTTGDQSASPSATSDSPVSISDDDTTTVSDDDAITVSDDDATTVATSDAGNATPSGGLSPDGVDTAKPVDKVSKTAGDGGSATKEASNQKPEGSKALKHKDGNEDALTAQALASVQKADSAHSNKTAPTSQQRKQLTRKPDDVQATQGTPKAQDVATAETSAKDISEGANKTANGVTKTAEGAGNVGAGVSRMKAGDGSGAIQAAEGAKEATDGAKETTAGTQQMVKGAQEGAKVIDQATNKVTNGDGVKPTSVANGNTSVANGNVAPVDAKPTPVSQGKPETGTKPAPQATPQATTQATPQAKPQQTGTPAAQPQSGTQAPQGNSNGTQVKPTAAPKVDTQPSRTTDVHGGAHGGNQQQQHGGTHGDTHGNTQQHSGTHGDTHATPTTTPSSSNATPTSPKMDVYGGQKGAYGGSGSQPHVGTQPHSGNQQQQHGGTHTQQHSGNQQQQHGGTHTQQHSGNQQQQHGGSEQQGNQNGNQQAPQGSKPQTQQTTPQARRLVRGNALRDVSTGLGNMGAGMERLANGDLGGFKQAKEGARQLAQGVRPVKNPTGAPSQPKVSNVQGQPKTSSGTQNQSKTSNGTQNQSKTSNGTQNQSKTSNGTSTSSTQNKTKAPEPTKSTKNNKQTSTTSNKTQTDNNVNNKVTNTATNPDARKLIAGATAAAVTGTKPLRNRFVESTARVWRETATLSGTVRHNPNDVYEEELRRQEEREEREERNRQAAQAYTPRNDRLQTRTDARIRRIKRPR